MSCTEINQLNSAELCKGQRLKCGEKILDINKMTKFQPGLRFTGNFFYNEKKPQPLDLPLEKLSNYHTNIKNGQSWTSKRDQNDVLCSDVFGVSIALVLLQEMHLTLHAIGEN